MANETKPEKYFDPLLRVQDVARRLDIGRSMAYQLLRSGELPSVRIGSKIVRVQQSDLEAYILNSRTSNQV